MYNVQPLLSCLGEDVGQDLDLDVAAVDTGGPSLGKAEHQAEHQAETLRSTSSVIHIWNAFVCDLTLSVAIAIDWDEVATKEHGARAITLELIVSGQEHLNVKSG